MCVDVLSACISMHLNMPGALGCEERVSEPLKWSYRWLKPPCGFWESKVASALPWVFSPATTTNILALKRCLEGCSFRAHIRPFPGVCNSISKGSCSSEGTCIHVADIWQTHKWKFKNALQDECIPSLALTICFVAEIPHVLKLSTTTTSSPVQ